MKSSTVVCPKELNIAHAAAFRDELLKVPAKGPVVIDVSSIQRIDGAGAQILLAFVQHLSAQGREWSWSERADVVDRAAETLGLSEALQLSAGKE